MFIYKRCHCRVTPGKYEFSDKQVSALEEKLKLFGVKARLELLLMLKEGPHCVCDLMTHTKLSQSLISHHLSDLTSAGFIEAKKEGKFMEYSLTESGEKMLKNLEDMIENFGRGGGKMKKMRNCDEQMRQRCCGYQEEEETSEIKESENEEMSKEELLAEKESLEKQLGEINEALADTE